LLCVFLYMLLFCYAASCVCCYFVMLFPVYAVILLCCFLYMLLFCYVSSCICCYFVMLLPVYAVILLCCFLYMLLFCYAASCVCCYFAMLLPPAGVVDDIILGGMTPCSLGLGRVSSLTRDRVDRHTCRRAVERTEAVGTARAALLFACNLYCPVAVSQQARSKQFG